MLRVFCDNCAGQNKNYYVLLSALRLIHERKVMRIEIIFMVSGHSYLPCDRNFGVLEKKFRVADTIHTTKHYVNVIKSATTPPYEVIVMERDDFLDIKPLLTYVSKRPTGPVSFSGARQLVVDAFYKEGFMVKGDYDLSDTNAHQVRLMKGNRNYSHKFFNLSSVPLYPLYDEDRKLQAKKVQDLGKLQRFMGPASQQWYAELLSKQRSSQAEETDYGVRDDSDSENDLDYYVDPARLNH